MRVENLNFIAPHAEDSQYDEAVVFGMISWLWAHSPLHRNASVGMLSVLAIPAMKHGQFMVAHENGKPVFYCAWAWFNEESERRYIIDPNAIFESDWKSGDRLWMTDWLAPFGHNRLVSKIVRDKLFALTAGRFLRYKTGPNAGRISTMRGKFVTTEQAKNYFSARPINL